MPAISIKFAPSGEKRKVDTSAANIQSLLDELNLNREAFVVKKNGRITPECEPLSDNDQLEIIKVVSGG